MEEFSRILIGKVSARSLKDNWSYSQSNLDAVEVIDGCPVSAKLVAV